MTDTSIHDAYIFLSTFRELRLLYMVLYRLWIRSQYYFCTTLYSCKWLLSNSRPILCFFCPPKTRLFLEIFNIRLWLRWVVKCFNIGLQRSSKIWPLTSDSWIFSLLNLVLSNRSISLLWLLIEKLAIKFAPQSNTRYRSKSSTTFSYYWL
jgi:hypothetical protein